ncbi:hypothetical protein G6F56_004849 [Rhizopus delemar]|nr:hypothetical protein G6F56_004849 [Rhizopus delemar]
MSLIVYGDSYSDITTQKRTNGPLWSQIIAKQWNTPLVSFAQSGAKICPSQTHSSWLQKQVLESNAQPGDIHVIFLGTTDIVESKEPTTKHNTWIQCIKDQVTFIHQQNPEARILIMGIPALDFSPYARTHPDLKEKIMKFNVDLEESVEEWKENATLEFYNTYSMFSDLLGDPSAAHIENVEEAYWDVCQGQCQTEINQYLWWDSIHMTGAGHSALAQGLVTSEFFGQKVMESTTEKEEMITQDYTQCLSWLLLGCVLMMLLYSFRHNRFFASLKSKIQMTTSKFKNNDYTLV